MFLPAQSPCFLSYSFVLCPKREVSLHICNNLLLAHTFRLVAGNPTVDFVYIKKETLCSQNDLYFSYSVDENILIFFMSQLR